MMSDPTVLHMRQSVNGCVTCPQRWSEHTADERIAGGICQWFDADVREVCGRPLPCSRHQKDHEGHPFGFTVHDTTLIDADRLLRLLASEEEEITAYLAAKPDDPDAPAWRGQLSEVRIIRDYVLALAQRRAA